MTSDDLPTAPSPTPALARRTLAAFLLTFLAARVTVLLIMSRRLPDLYLHLGGTHVHHLNYGILLLAALPAHLLFRPPTQRPPTLAATAYGIALALTFDEFGMWLHLGGPYWQRASFDAITVIASLLALIAFAPTWTRWRPTHWWFSAILLITITLFTALLAESLTYLGSRLGPKLEKLESNSPP